MKTSSSIRPAVSFFSALRLGIAVTMLALCCSYKAHAIDATWTNTNAGGWGTATNWSGGVVPGSTNALNNQDTATIGANLSASLPATNTIDMGGGSTYRNILGLTFNGTDKLVRLNNGNLYLSDGGYVRTEDNVTAGLVGVTVQGDGGSATFTANSTNQLTLSSVTGVSTAGKTTTITLNGTGLGSAATAFSAGAGGGTLKVVKSGSGAWIYNFLNISTLSILEGELRSTGAGTGSIAYLGDTSGAKNATLNLSSVGDYYANTIVQSGSTGTLTISKTNSGISRFRQEVTLLGDLKLDTVSGTDFQTYYGFGGAGNVTKTGAGTLSLAATTARQGTGTYFVNEGTLSFGGASSLSSKNGVDVASGAFFKASANSSFGGLDGAGTFDFNGAAARTVRFGGMGSYDFAGTISNTGAGAMALTMDLKEGGTQVFSGVNNLKSTMRVRSGTLGLNYATSDTSKLSDTNILYLDAGTLDLQGGTHTEIVTSTTVANGQSTIARSSGASTIMLSNITVNGGHLNIEADNIAKSTTANSAGILGGQARLTVGGADYAKNDGANNIVALAAGDYTALTAGTAGSNSGVYSLSGSMSGWSANDLAVRGLKISTTADGQSLDLGSKTLKVGSTSTDGSILFTGSNDYSITSTGYIASAANGFAVINYGTGKLTLNAGISHPAHFFGTGHTILNKDASAAAGLTVGGGTLEFSSNAQIGTTNGNGGITLWGGKLLANTAGGDISLNNGTGGLSNRVVNVGGNNAVLDIIGGGTLTVGGVVGNANTDGENPLTIGSATSSGKIVFSGTNTWTGDIKLAGATLSVSQDVNLGSTNNWIEFTGNGALQTTGTFTNTRVVNIRSGATGTFAPDAGTTLTIAGYGIRGAGDLVINGPGTVELNATNVYSVNNYTGKTTIENGTLKLGAGASIASSSEVNLGKTNAPGTLDLTANSSYAFGSSQTVSGAGTISIGSGKTVTVAGILAPGNSTGKIIVGGNLSLASTSEIKMELAGTGGVAGTDFDQIDVSGYTLTADGTLTITGWSGYDVTQTATYDLFDFSTFSGNFDNVTVGGFTLTYDDVSAWKGTNGLTTYSLGINNGILAVETVPEPSTYALLGLAGVATAAYRLRRRNR